LNFILCFLFKLYFELVDLFIYLRRYKTYKLYRIFFFSSNRVGIKVNYSVKILLTSILSSFLVVLLCQCVFVYIKSIFKIIQNENLVTISIYIYIYIYIYIKYCWRVLFKIKHKEPQCDGSPFKIIRLSYNALHAR
jgi:hypothetical protein